MASITIRNLDDDLKDRLRVRAASNGHSMEEEVRLILKRAVAGADGETVLRASRALFSGDDGVELDLPSRADRSALNFET